MGPIKKVPRGTPFCSNWKKSQGYFLPLRPALPLVTLEALPFGVTFLTEREAAADFLETALATFLEVLVVFADFTALVALALILTLATLALRAGVAFAATATFAEEVLVVSAFLVDCLASMAACAAAKRAMGTRKGEQET